MNNASEVATAKTTAGLDLKGLDAGAALQRAFSEQTEAELVDDWLVATSQAIESTLRTHMKKQP